MVAGTGSTVAADRNPHRHGGRPGVRRLIWTAYLVMAAEGFLVYAVGFITPYVQSSLHVEPWLAQMPNSMMAVGLGVGGGLARGLNARFGADRTIRVWILAFALSAVMLAAPVSILMTIAGGFTFGAALGGWLVHVNSALGQGRSGAMMLTRANLWSVAGGLVGPLVLAAAASSVGWWYGALAPVPFFLVLVFLTPGSPARDQPAQQGVGEPPLSREFWLAWLFLTLSIGAEFSYVVWGAQVVTSRTGVSIAAATGLAAAFSAGMVGGRLVASFVDVRRERQLLVLRAGTALTALGAVLVWAAWRPEIALLGLFLGGLGMAPVYPFGASLALAHAPDAPVRASARLTLASSLSILVAPLALGLVAGVAGIVAAWIIVIGILATAFAVVLLVGVPATAVDHADVLPG
jgi:MFS family permease